MPVLPKSGHSKLDGETRLMSLIALEVLLLRTYRF